MRVPPVLMAVAALVVAAVAIATSGHPLLDQRAGPRLLVTPAGRSCPTNGGSSRGTETITLRVGTETRRYDLFLPPRHSPPRPLPLLIAFHGYGSSPARLDAASRLTAVAGDAGAAVAIPYAAGRPARWSLPGRLRGGDDLAFVDRLLADAHTRSCLDPNRTVAVGFSNGAAFASMLACRRSGALAGVVLAGGANLDEPCPQGPPVAALILHGAEDRVVPVAGGPVLGGRLRARPLAEAVGWWAARARCGGPSPLVPLASLRTSTHLGSPAPPGCDAPVLALLTPGGHRWSTDVTAFALRFALEQRRLVTPAVDGARAGPLRP